MSDERREAIAKIVDDTCDDIMDNGPLTALQARAVADRILALMDTPEEPCVEGEGAAKHLCRMCAVGVTDCKHPVCVDCLKRVDDHFTQSVAPEEPEPVAYTHADELQALAHGLDANMGPKRDDCYDTPLFAHPPRAEGDVEDDDIDTALKIGFRSGYTGGYHDGASGNHEDPETAWDDYDRARLIIEQGEEDG